MLDLLVRRGIALGAFLWATAAQVSGYINIWIAVGLAVLGLIAFAFPTSHHTIAWYKARAANAGVARLELSAPIIIGLILGWLVLTAALGTVLFQQWFGGAPANDPKITALQSEIATLKTQLTEARQPRSPTTRLAQQQAQPQPKQYTAYEKEQRLRAIDEIYDVVATTMAAAYVEGRDLFNGLKNEVAQGTAEKRLRDHYATVENAFAKLRGSLKKYEYFSDIVGVATANTFNGLNEMVACDNLINEINLIRGIAPNSVGPFLDRDIVWMEARNANREFEKYLGDTLPALKQKRAEIESAVVHPGQSK
jgi:hypothetical protein